MSDGQAAGAAAVRLPALDAASRPDGQLINELAYLAEERGALDLALGAPDFAPPPELARAAVAAFRKASHQYTRNAGLPELCRGIADRAGALHGAAVDAEAEVTVTCGVTEATMAALLALGRPGSEVVLFEPCYVNYLPAVQAAGMTPRLVRLHGRDWELDRQELARAFNANTRLVLLNTPGNPSGKVFDAAELAAVAELCERWNAWCVSDEIYERLVFGGRRHLSALAVPGLRERSAVASGFSKTYGVTGWRVGYVIAPPPLTSVIRGVHEFLTCCAPEPLQAAALAALRLPASYHERLRGDLESRRDRLVAALEAAGCACRRADGSFFVMADVSRCGLGDDAAFVRRLIEEIGVAAVPGSAFYAERGAGASLVRFCFGKSEQTIAGAVQRLGRLRPPACP
jgi:aspartate/methionine/tyrosine aminotransferase